MKAKVAGTEIKQDGADALLIVDSTGGIDSIRWRMTAEGLLKVDMLCLNNGRNAGGFIDENITAFGYWPLWQAYW